MQLSIFDSIRIMISNEIKNHLINEGNGNIYFQKDLIQTNNEDESAFSYCTWNRTHFSQTNENPQLEDLYNEKELDLTHSIKERFDTFMKTQSFYKPLIQNNGLHAEYINNTEDTIRLQFSDSMIHLMEIHSGQY